MFVSSRTLTHYIFKRVLSKGKTFPPLVAINAQIPTVLIPNASFSRTVKKIPKLKKAAPVATQNTDELAVSPPPPALKPIEESWVEVQDKASGQIYWWNTVTNETTALGAPRPTGPTALATPQQPQSGGGLGSVIAEGFAFGAGSAIAHNVVGSFFGGGGHSSSSSSTGDDSSGGDDSWDV